MSEELPLGAGRWSNRIQECGMHTRHLERPSPKRTYSDAKTMRLIKLALAIGVGSGFLQDAVVEREVAFAIAGA